MVLQHPFRSQGRGNILAAAASSSSKQASKQAATELISAYPHISINIDGTSPKLHSPNDALQSHKVSGQNSSRGSSGGQKILKNPQNVEKLSPARGGGYWGGRPLWNNSTYLCQHRRDITQTFMVDSPSDPIQTTRFRVKTHERAGLVGTKVLKTPKKS